METKEQLIVLAVIIGFAIGCFIGHQFRPNK